MVKIQNLSAGYHGNKVLFDISAEFPSEKVTMIIGPNGCGKSTLLRTALGLHPKISGHVFCEKTDLSMLTRTETAKRIAFLAQEHAIPNIMVEKMVLHGRYPYLSFPRQYSMKYTPGEEIFIFPEESGLSFLFDVDEELTDDPAAMNTVGEMLDEAEELAEKNMMELSGGQRQKIYLAMALAQDTPNLWLDEPTTYLDLRHQMEVMKIARKLAAEKKSVVMIIHDLCMALQTADRLLVMNEGKKVQEGTPDEVFQTGVLKNVFGVTVDRLATPNGWRYYLET